MPKKTKGQSGSGGYEYRFVIDAYTPGKFPMPRLALYMAELSALLGEQPAAHFRRLESGSIALVHTIEKEAVPKVRGRTAAVGRGKGEPEAPRAYRAINKLLREDNATGEFREKCKTAKVLQSPRKLDVPEKFSTVRQYGSIDGVIIGIGGKDETLHIRLDSEGCQLGGHFTTRAIARELGHALFEPGRLFGRGRWNRDDDGNWTLEDFKVESFGALKGAPLSDALTALRKKPADWTDDALRELVAIRHRPGEAGMVVIDATTLFLMLRPGTPVPAGPDGAPVDKPRERIEHLIKTLEKEMTKIIIPAPALNETLVRAGTTACQKIVDELQKQLVFRMESFVLRAAIEVAANDVLRAGPWQGQEAGWLECSLVQGKMRPPNRYYSPCLKCHSNLF